MRDTYFPIADELKHISRARVTLQGNRATLVESVGRVRFVFVLGLWLVDWASG